MCNKCKWDKSFRWWWRWRWRSYMLLGPCEYYSRSKKNAFIKICSWSGVWIILSGFHFLVILEKFQYSIIDFEILIHSIEFYGCSGVLFSGYCTSVWSYRKISNACKLNWRFIDFAEQNEQTKMEQKRYKIALYA